MNRDEAESRAFLRSVVGSTVLGLSVEGSDRDEMGICIEPMELAMGVGAPFEQYTEDSGDFTIYSLRKWCRLALKGNPTVLGLLWVPSDADTMIRCTAKGSQLRDLAPCFVARQAGNSFLGYLQAQRMRMTGERGHGRHGRPREELVEQFGYDTKYAMHMLRLGFQGVELLQTGRISFPVPEPERLYLLDVRAGRISFQDCLTKAGELEAELKDLIKGGSPFQDQPNSAAVDEWMLRAYIRSWSADRTFRDMREDAARWHEAAR